MMGSGLVIYTMDKALLAGQMVEFMKVSGEME